MGTMPILNRIESKYVHTTHMGMTMELQALRKGSSMRSKGHTHSLGFGMEARSVIWIQEASLAPSPPPPFLEIGGGRGTDK